MPLSSLHIQMRKKTVNTVTVHLNMKKLCMKYVNLRLSKNQHGPIDPLDRDLKLIKQVTQFNL